MTIIRIILTLMSFVASLAAQMVSSGGYTFTIDATNENFRPIYNIRASAFVSGTHARIEFSAPGYQDGRETVYLNSNQKHYRVRVRMSDPSVWVRAQSKKVNNLNVSVNQSQFMATSADRYVFEVLLRNTGFSKFTYRDIEVRVNGMWAFAPRIQVSGQDGSRRIHVEVRREDLRSFSNQVVVEVPSDEELTPARRKRLQALSFELIQSEGMEETIRAQKMEELKELRGLLGQ
ncbi:MAG: hypothetical protein H3C47_01410 [Candidatus Cloacimonetes bacterium]|nr:hypothetical protein [Candidatus Cloacimonadota bacterium]